MAANTKMKPPASDWLCVCIQPRWIDNTRKLDQVVVTDVTATVTFGKASRRQDVSEDQSPGLSAAVKRSKKQQEPPIILCAAFGGCTTTRRGEEGKGQGMENKVCSFLCEGERQGLFGFLASSCIPYDFLLSKNVLHNHC